ACWSTGLGYNCCQSCIAVAYEDNDGKWGVENNNWCGIPKNCNNNNNASDCRGAQGYPCCNYNCDVYSIDGDGRWSIENNDWCLINNS
ncbi:Non-catalytic module family DOC2, partial [Piromyces sp. E2]